MKKISIWLLTFIFLANQGLASDIQADLQQVLEQFHRENPQAPGAIAYVQCKPLNLEWYSATGKVEKKGKDLLTTDYTFRIASNTKTYVAAAILRLVETGRLHLSDTMGQLLDPEVQTILRQDYPIDDMTLEMVLSHTSGLNEHPADERYVDAILAEPFRQWAPLEQVKLCVEWLNPVGKPGEKYSYSDTGYILLGMIVEKVTHEKLGVAVHSLLGYEKLGLSSTFWEYMESAPRDHKRAHQYYEDHDVTSWNASFDLYGGGGIVSSTKDLALFMEALLTGKVFEKEDTLKTMMQKGTSPYRLGLMHATFDGMEAFGHQGFWNTFSYYVPAIETTVAGCITSHNATNGKALADKLIQTVSLKLE